MSKELECLDRIDKRNYLTEREHKEFLGVVEQALKEYEAIENANPSEALECLEKVYSRLPQWDLSRNVDQCNIIKQALLKAQEPKKYLKWEDLEFKKERQTIKVRMGNNIYNLLVFKYGNKRCHLCNEEETLIYDIQEQLFNDLHLEVKK